VRVGPTLDQIIREYPADARVVFKMHPLSMHPNAQIAAEAALAAHAQGKFVEMHEKLLENSRSLSRDTILGLAGDVGLDVERFTRELDSHAHAAQIESETKEVVAVGATGTPASFINGRYLRGAKPFAAFKEMIDEELAWVRKGDRPAFKTGSNVAEASPPRAAAPAPAPVPDRVYDIPVGGAPARGAAKAKVTIQHYLDYQ